MRPRKGKILLGNSGNLNNSSVQLNVKMINEKLHKHNNVCTMNTRVMKIKVTHMWHNCVKIKYK